MEQNKLDQAFELLKEWQAENPEKRAMLAATIDTASEENIRHVHAIAGTGQNCIAALSLALLENEEACQVVGNALGTTCAYWVNRNMNNGND